MTLEDFFFGKVGDKVSHDIRRLFFDKVGDKISRQKNELWSIAQQWKIIITLMLTAKVEVKFQFSTHHDVLL
jgi:hypothetical protein